MYSHWLSDAKANMVCTCLCHAQSVINDVSGRTAMTFDHCVRYSKIVPEICGLVIYTIDRKKYDLSGVTCNH